jgi:asparagine synthase (glutamine-hydrolysing)
MDHTLSHLLHRMDANMMQESVEARVPFLDPRVVRLALNLPLESRIGPWSKGILRDVARRLLPVRVAHRPKVYGMDYDAGAWILAEADTGFLLHGMLADVTGIAGNDLLRFATESPGALPVRVWSAEIWCRSVLASESADAIAATLWR